MSKATITRRSFLLSALVASVSCRTSLAEALLSKEEWMAAWMDAPKPKEAIGQLWLGRFLDPMYFLLKPIEWRPNEPQTQAYPSVQVPEGFVTDLASIPWPLWSAGLRPDGQYAFAAIIHDFLYWTQSTKRAEADDILKLAMQDLRVSPAVIETIFVGVRAGGEAAWNGNAELKTRGEKRILQNFPDSATVKWEEWKARPDVFAK